MMKVDREGDTAQARQTWQGRERRASVREGEDRRERKEGTVNSAERVTPDIRLHAVITPMAVWVTDSGSGAILTSRQPSAHCVGGK